jgi:thioredoxin reductase (NADPH)
MILLVRESHQYHNGIFSMSWFPSSKNTRSNTAASSSSVRVLRRKNDLEIYDIVVAGAGVAGLSSALFAARAGLKVLVLGSSQGLLSQTKQLDNFPSFLGDRGSSGSNSVPASGESWLEATRRQAEDFGAMFAPPGLLATAIERSRLAGEEDDDINLRDNQSFFTLKTALDEYHAWSVIVASGATPKTLNLPNEGNLWGVSLHNCAICDGHLYTGKDKHVLVVGGGDAALDAAIMLARYAGHVTLVHRRNEFTSANNPASLQIVKSTPNIEILTPFVVERWKTDHDNPTQLLGAMLKDQRGGMTKDIQIDGAFVMIGANPNTEWIYDIGIDLDDEGLIQLPYQKQFADVKNGSTFTTQSSVPGIFAAGEVTDRIYKQAITAAGSGAEAAIDAERWLRERHGVTFRESVRKRKPSMVVHNPSIKNVRRENALLEPKHRQKRDSISQGQNEARSDEGCDLATPDCIQSIVHEHPVVVFSKPWCPFCRKALEALSAAGVKEPYVIDLSQYSNTQKIQSTLQQLTGRRTVPNVFVGSKSIGGGDETAGLLRTNELIQLLQVAGALPTEQEKSEDARNPQAGKLQDGKEACDLLSEDCFNEVVSKYPVLIFSLSWCPECKQSLELLRRIGVKPHIIDLDDYKPISQDIRLHMLNMTGRRSVPNLFISGEYIGGFRRTSEMHEKGELIPRFEKAGVVFEVA